MIQGPRFSTARESRWYPRQGWHVVNMTQYPEAYLARELGMHYAGIALVTELRLSQADVHRHGLSTALPNRRSRAA